MAMAIDGFECTLCGDCRPACPTEAIALEEGVYRIDATRCNECAENGGEPRCLAVCPVDFCIQPLAG